MPKRSIFLTSALPYANGPLHLGHLAGAYLPADLYVRYKRLTQADIVFICGSDEHGVPITIASVSSEGAEAAKSRIEDIVAEVEVGRIYEGTVLKLLDFGAIVSILPGKDGLLHISQIANERVNAVADYLKDGQKVRVKVLEADEKGRVRLSMKAVAAEAASAEAPQG